MNFLYLSQGKLILRDLTFNLKYSYNWNLQLSKMCIYMHESSHINNTPFELFDLEKNTWPTKLINKVMNYNLVATCLHVHIVAFHQCITFCYHYKVHSSVVWFLIWFLKKFNLNFDFYLVLRLGLWISKTSNFVHFNKEFKIDST